MDNATQHHAGTESEKRQSLVSSLAKELDELKT